MVGDGDDVVCEVVESAEVLRSAEDDRCTAAQGYGYRQI
jgi:EAL domain-containing protein (putative c-di-GMP-specific phosphodiesterase class I)